MHYDYTVVDGHRLCPLRGEALAGNPHFNKGTAFSERERDEFGLRGLLPPRVASMEQQLERVLDNYRRKSTDLERYIHLISLLDRNETLFYRLVLDHLEEMLPIVYTPTVGEACRKFGQIYRRPRGLYVTPADRGRVASLFDHWPFRDVRVIVVTDGERILGLGDLGASGMGIPIGKLSLYVAAGGIRPSQTLPVCLDVGTDREELLGDPLYLGTPQKRLRGPAYDELLEEFVRAANRKFPGVLIQFEDFVGPNALRLLDLYRDRVCCFNDDIQGTGAVALAALLASERVTGRRLPDEKVVIAGAGGAGTGIARAICAAMKEEGLSDEAARSRIWTTDSKGLVTKTGDPYKREFAREGGPATFEETVRAVRPTVLVGVAGTAGLFSEDVLRNLADRPVVLPLSNPTSLSECTPEDVRRATGGRGLCATGSPFAGASQCNNVFVFPAVGLGVLASRADRVTDRMFLAAARKLAALADVASGQLLPRITDIRRVELEVARAVAGDAPIEQWEPVYLPYRAV